jgi:hypothetical protein
MNLVQEGVAGGIQLSDAVVYRTYEIVKVATDTLASNVGDANLLLFVTMVEIVSRGWQRKPPAEPFVLAGTKGEGGAHATSSLTTTAYSKQNGLAM